jgi:N-acetyl-gamma-glutamyl-phosphate reductase
MKAAVIGTSGYTGLILLRLLTNHPEVTEIIPVSSSREGKSIAEIDPGLGRETVEKCTSTRGKAVSISECAGLQPDVVFAALPHLKSALLCEPFYGKSVVIDLSADFRLKDEAIFREAYNAPMPKPGFMDKVAYGLAEWYHEDIKTADIIANPGCYPTASLIPLLPAAKEGLITGTCVINAISGISGAGKKLKEMLLFCERTENTCAYSPGKIHRHTPEIQQEVTEAHQDIDVLFTPHLAPLKRGMVATTAVSLTQQVSDDDMEALYQSCYGTHPFIRIIKSMPQTRDVWGSNRCDISWHIQGNTLMLFSAIDNLMKGASGQAVQNMNIRMGFPEQAGLPLHNQL